MSFLVDLIYIVLLITDYLPPMNIQTLAEKIKVFEKEIVESGFIRDAQAYQTAISQPDTQNNLVQLKDIANKLADSLKDLQEKDFESEMLILFPKRHTFVDKDHLETLEEILNDTTITPQDFYSRFSSELTGIITEVTSCFGSDENGIS